MISTMRERMSAKMGNSNDNAFKMRKLFKMYDKEDTGLVRPARGRGRAGRGGGRDKGALGSWDGMTGEGFGVGFSRRLQQTGC
jgi:hypothetical protein